MLTELLSLSEKLKRLREKFGFTQAELADKLKLTRSAVNAWEMGNAVPSTEVIIKLARIFSVSADYLLGIDDVEMISVKGLSSKEVATVSNVIDCFLENKNTK
ncbi:MAG: helix-turn-helix domain-containing protein [Clostridiales Family XIII bacterium]|nr:helix-turn-helix domain-containing protein [Clostridiales Family XIII bacterium]